MDDKNQQFSYFETGMKMSVKCVSLLGKAYEGRDQEDGAVLLPDVGLPYYDQFMAKPMFCPINDQTRTKLCPRPY